MEKISITTPSIRLDQFLKWANLVNTGGEAKILIASEQVAINGAIVTQRSKKLVKGDQVQVKDQSFEIV